MQPRARKPSGSGAVEELFDNFDARHALAVLGPDPFAPLNTRKVVLLHPPELARAAEAIATSADFGATWRDERGSPVGWETLDRQRASSEWRELWHSSGFRSFVRVEFPLPANQAFECFMFTEHELRDTDEAARLSYWIQGSWRELRDEIQFLQSPLNERERLCLVLAFQGFTASETAERLDMPERRVTSTYQQAMEKLQVNSKIAAIQRACWLGVI